MALDVSVSALSPPERLEAVRDYMLSWRLPMDLRPHQPLNVTARSQEIDLGEICLLSTHGSGATVVRDVRLSRDDSPPLVVLTVLGAGTSVLDQHDRAAHLRVGDVAAYISFAPFRNTFPVGTTRHSFLIPADLLGLPDRLLRDVVARPFGPGMPLTRVVSSYLMRVAATAPAMSRTERDAVQEPTVALARALLSVASEEDARIRGALGETLDTRILEYLRLHLADADLTAARIAAVHGISERHLYTVLTRHGISLRSWLREQRLAAAARTLTGPGNRHLTIAAVAHRWGFADHAHFTREFRRRYGATPSEWRRSSSAE